MSAIAGIYCADGHPVEDGPLARMAEAIAHRAPDGITYWRSGSVAFAHLAFHTTPESLHEQQPLVSPSGDLCLAWDGRLDNREELLAALGAERAQLFDTTDPGIVLAAYRAWGTACVERFYGDFALTLWDARQNRLWCARDFIGVRPFYYFWNGKTFLFAPEVRALLEHPLVSTAINEGMVGEYLADAITSRDETLYRDIRRLPSGSTLTIDDQGLRIAEWWNPDLDLLHYRNDDEYAEHFRALFDASVRARMRSSIPWGVPLSGGLDSSSIAVTAQALLRARESEEQVAAFSLVGPGKRWDESDYIAETVRMAGLRSEFFSALPTDEEFFRAQARRLRTFPDQPSGSPMMEPMARVAERSGVRVVLSGIGGNEWLDGTPLYTLDLLRDVVRYPGNSRDLFGQAREDWLAYDGRGRWPFPMVRYLVQEAVPKAVYARRAKRQFEERSFLSRSFLRRTGLVDRIYGLRQQRVRRFASRAQADVYTNVVNGLEAYMLESNDLHMALAGLEVRFPFHDRRLAEFCLRLPAAQRQRGEAWKWVLRNAMRGRLPERVRLRTKQVEFSQLFEDILYRPWAQERRKNLTLARNTDWLDKDRFFRMAELPAQSDRSSFGRYRPLWMVLGIDFWVESACLQMEK